jgi:uncharacterized protein with ATP-grasp and redox domains
VETRLRSFEKIIYLTDNAGEAVFDLFVIDKLEEMGKHVVIGSKSEPVLNDVTAAEMKGMTTRDVLPTGPVVGTSLDEITPEAKALLLDKSWLIIAKGMGNFETISEYQDILKGRLIYILRAKCEPVATRIGVHQGSLIVRAL